MEKTMRLITWRRYQIINHDKKKQIFNSHEATKIYTFLG